MNHLLDFCATDRQREVIEAVIKHGSNRAAAKALSVHKTAVDRIVVATKKRAAAKGVAPDTDLNYPLSEIERLKGRSSLVNKKTGETLLQWVKTDVSQEKLVEVMRETIDALKEDLPRYDPIPAPAVSDELMLTQYTITDAHVGAMAWSKEAGADWDLSIATDTISRVFGRLINDAPSSGTAVVAQIGDYLHQDSIQAVTPTNGHLLDADGRFSKVVNVAIKVLRNVVDLALKKHGRVILVIAEGNHDISSSIWLREVFKIVYENDPRVDVLDSVLPYVAHKHGDVMLAWHHGHLKRNDDLPLLFASQFPELWGSTKYRYAHSGHKHHAEEKEHSGMTVIQHPTIAARDAYAARGGWISERRATAITYHAHGGITGRHSVIPEMVC